MQGAEAIDTRAQGLLGVTKGKGATVGGGAAAVVRAVAERAADDHRCVGFELLVCMHSPKGTTIRVPDISVTQTDSQNTVVCGQSWVVAALAAHIVGHRVAHRARLSIPGCQSATLAQHH